MCENGTENRRMAGCFSRLTAVASIGQYIDLSIKPTPYTIPSPSPLPSYTIYNGCPRADGHPPSTTSLTPTYTRIHPSPGHPLRTTTSAVPKLSSFSPPHSWLPSHLDTFPMSRTQLPFYTLLLHQFASVGVITPVYNVLLLSI